MNLFTQTVVRLGQRLARRVGHYAEGGLISIHDHEFLDNPDFQVAYQRGLQSGQGVLIRITAGGVRIPRCGWHTPPVCSTAILPNAALTPASSVRL